MDCANRYVSILLGLILFSASHNTFSAFDSLKVSHPKTLLLTVKWGDKPGSFGLSDDPWEGGVEYFYIDGNNIVAFDRYKQEISYFRDNKYIKSFPVPQFSPPLGLLLKDGTVYYFLEDGAAAFSLVNGKYLYNPSLPTPFPQDTRFYWYDDTIVSTSNDSLSCLSETLQVTECPNTIKHRHKNRADYTHFSDGSYAFMQHSTIESNKVYASLFNNEGSRISSITSSRQTELRFDAPGSPYITRQGLYYVEHNDDECLIWFVPWLKISD